MRARVRSAKSPVPEGLLAAMAHVIGACSGNGSAPAGSAVAGSVQRHAFARHAPPRTRAEIRRTLQLTDTIAIVGGGPRPREPSSSTKWPQVPGGCLVTVTIYLGNCQLEFGSARDASGALVLEAPSPGTSSSTDQGWCPSEGLGTNVSGTLTFDGVSCPAPSDLNGAPRTPYCYAGVFELRLTSESPDGGSGAALTGAPFHLAGAACPIYGGMTTSCSGCEADGATTKPTSAAGGRAVTAAEHEGGTGHMASGAYQTSSGVGRPTPLRLRSSLTAIAGGDPGVRDAIRGPDATRRLSRRRGVEPLQIRRTDVREDGKSMDEGGGTSVVAGSSRHEVAPTCWHAPVRQQRPHGPGTIGGQLITGNTHGAVGSMARCRDSY